MKVAVVGSGYVGSVVGGVLSQYHDVEMVDIDPQRVEMIRRRIPPIHEEGLPELYERGRITSSLELTTKPDVVYLCVGTPGNPDGSVNTQYIEEASRSLRRRIGPRTVIAIKSTVPPDLYDNICEWAGTGKVVMNPEFMREGSAIKDFQTPDRILLGGDQEAMGRVEKLYFPWSDRNKIIKTSDPRIPHLVKYLGNSFLPYDISGANQMEIVLYEMGINYEDLMERLSEYRGRFLWPGFGWGGSCFGKDLRATIEMFRKYNVDPSLLESALEINENQPRRGIELMEDIYGGIPERLGILGLAFKPGTDDTRDTPAIGLVRMLPEEVEIYGYDPLARENFSREEGMGRVNLVKNPEEVIERSDGLFIVKNTGKFGELEYPGKVVVDGERAFSEIPDGVRYRGIGRPQITDNSKLGQGIRYFRNFTNNRTHDFFGRVDEICEAMGIDPEEVKYLLSLDHRIPNI